MTPPPAAFDVDAQIFSFRFVGFVFVVVPRFALVLPLLRTDAKVEVARSCTREHPVCIRQARRAPGRRRFLLGTGRR